MSVDTDLPEGGDDILAAEFALGVLPDEDQAALARRADIDPAFARLVADWQDRLLPLADEFAPAVLPPAVKGALDLRLFGAVSERPGAWRSLALWRGLTAAATAAFLLALSLPLLSPTPPAPEMRLVALLAHEGSNVHYMAVYDTDDGAVGLSHLSGNPGPGQDFDPRPGRGGGATGHHPGTAGRIGVRPAQRRGGGGGRPARHLTRRQKKSARR